jgi:hypothetical protein
MFAGTSRTLALVVAGLLSLAPTSMGQAHQPIIDVHKHASWPGAADAAARNARLREMDAEGIVLSVLHINEPDNVKGGAVQSLHCSEQNPSSFCNAPGSEPPGHGTLRSLTVGTRFRGATGLRSEPEPVELAQPAH